MHIQTLAYKCISYLVAGNVNPYIWSAWGWLEARTGNVERARKLYDAAVVVDGTHACAWHKWGMLEKGQGNFTRARDLWMQVRGGWIGGRGTFRTYPSAESRGHERTPSHH